MPSIVTVIKDSKDIHFIVEKKENTANKVIILTKEEYYSINDQDARFMELLR